jgi:Glycosyl transferases group 1
MSYRALGDSGLTIGLVGTLMSQRIAETLILTMTRGMSLSEWQRLGLIGREWALYDLLGENYERIVVISHGGSEDIAIAEALGGHVIAIVNEDGLDATTYVSTLMDRLDRFVGPIRDAVIKTNQMDDAGAACAIAAGLRDRGCPVGLIARCGYLRSQFLARDLGPGSVEARDAALIEATVIGSSDLVVGTTSEIVDDLSWRDGLDAEGVRVIPNYVNMEDPVLSAEDRVPGLAVYVGQLVERKRVESLIRAIAEQPPEEHAVLEIIGDGPERGALEGLATELEAPVKFLGLMDHEQALERMSRASVYLHASLLEGHPKSVIEAMACGTPCIVADTPGLGSLVENGVTGIRVPGEAETFAYALAGVLSDIGWRNQLGACASERARKKYGLDKVIELEREAHATALELGQAHDGTASPLIRWNSALLVHSPERVAQAWQDALESLLVQLPESRRTALIEAMGRRKARQEAA